MQRKRNWSRVFLPLAAGAAFLLASVAAAQEAQDPSPELDAAMGGALELLAAEKHDEAAAAFRAILEDHPDLGVAWGNLGLAYQGAGNYEEAVKAYKQAEGFPGVSPIAKYNLACVYSLMGEADQAFHWLDEVLEVGFRNLRRLQTDPDLDNIRADPRFEDALIRAGAHPRTCERDPKFHRLDFWVGRWDVFDGEGRLTGRNHVVKRKKGCVILESWMGLRESSHGMSMNFLDPGSGKWRQDWVSDRGAVIHYEGEWKDGAMQFRGEHVAADGTKQLSRMTLSPREDGTVHQRIEQSKDDGATWYVWFDGNYVPVKDPKETGPASDE